MQILNISKLRNGIGILKKQENITENLTAEENRKEITETMENAAAEKKPTQTGTKEYNSQKEENRRGSRERRKRRKG